MNVRYHFRHALLSLGAILLAAGSAVAQPAPTASATDAIQVSLVLSQEQLEAGDTVSAKLIVRNVGTQRYDEVEWGIEQHGRMLSHGSIRKINPGETIEKSTNVVLSAEQKELKGWARLRDELAEPLADRGNNSVSMGLDVKPAAVTASQE